jgi:hypothetical protein
VHRHRLGTLGNRLRTELWEVVDRGVHQFVTAGAGRTKKFLG